MDEAVIGLTAQVVSGYVSNNSLSGEQLPELIRAVYKSLSTAGTAAAAPAKVEAAVDVKKSVFGDRLICLVCGKPFRTLKRHLNTEHQLTPAAYRGQYQLPASYPVVAPEYAKLRSAMAKKIGLGRGGNPKLAATKVRGKRR